MIAIGSDHGGVELKEYLAGVLRAKGLEVQDFGTRGPERSTIRISAGTFRSGSLGEKPTGVS